MIAGRHAFFALLRGGEVVFNTLTIWRHCFACCCLLLLSISASGAELRGGGVRVTDGDTIFVKVGADQHKIRLSGVDAPEIERLQYEAAEGEAREAKRGLWQQQQAIQPLEWLYWRESVRLLA